MGRYLYGENGFAELLMGWDGNESGERVMALMGGINSVGIEISEIFNQLHLTYLDFKI